MDPDARRLLLARYADGPRVVSEAWARVPEVRRDRRPADGGWTAREVIHHLADSEALSHGRVRQLLADEAPRIAAYDQDRWAAALHYDRPAETSLAVLVAVRASTVALLAEIGPADWERSG